MTYRTDELANRLNLDTTKPSESLVLIDNRWNEVDLTSLS